MYERASKNTEEKTFTATNFDEFVDTAKNHPGFIKAMWCGDSACEDKLKDATGGVKSRCIPLLRSTSAMFVYAAANLLSTRFIGVSSIN